MAGIGFRLQRYFVEGNVLGFIQGACYSVIISTGPWLITILAISLVSIYAQTRINIHDLYIFKSMICYTYASSLVLFGLIEMPLTRYIADQIYKDDYTTFKSVFVTVVSFFILLTPLLAGSFYSSFNEFSTLTKLSGMLFFASVLVIWPAMIFLSAAKNFHQIIFSFLWGAGASALLSIQLGKHYELPGYILGYAMGQMLLAIGLASNVMHEFKTTDYFSLDFLSYFSKHKILVAVGLFYYLGIWSDKVIFWFGPEGEKILHLFYTNHYYDTAMFLAYLSIVPSLAIFLVQVETNFAKRYFFYFQAIEKKNNLNVINENVNDIVISVREGLYRLFRIQTLITFLLWYFAEKILGSLYFPAIMTSIFKYGIIGAYMQSLFVSINIMLLYFLQHKKVFIHYLLFFLLNTGLSLVTSRLDYRYYGLGYLISTFITLLLSFFALNHILKKLNFYTFMGQPIYA